MNRVILILLSILLLAGCATTIKPETDGPTTGVKSFAFVDGSVVDVAGDMFTVRTDVSINTTGQNFYGRVTGRVIEKAFLLENMKTRINGREATLLEKRGNLLIFAGKGHGLKTGDVAKIYVPKKTMAVSSFKAYKNNTEDIGDVWLEGLTTAVVNTGQFIVVERSRLAEILNELKLELSGLTDSSKASKVGKLLNADIILTGSINDIGGMWDVNLRLVDTATSVIIAAINEKMTYEDLKPGSMRDAGNLNATFETEDHMGFNFGFRGKSKMTRNIYIDNDGADGTAKSARVDFTIKGTKSVSLSNSKDRDLSAYEGVQFYAKADKKINIKFVLTDENRDNAHAIDFFQRNVVLTTQWKKYMIPFSSLSYMKDIKNKADGLKDGDTVLNLDLVRDVRFLFNPRITPYIDGKPVLSGSYWIDEIKFY